MVQRHHDEQLKEKHEGEAPEAQGKRGDADKEKLPDITMASSERATFIPENDDSSFDNDSETPIDEKDADIDRDIGCKSSSVDVNVWLLTIV